VERYYNEFGFYETFYDWTSGRPVAAHYDYSPEKAPIYLLVTHTDAGRVVESHHAATHGFALEAYRWTGDLVSEVSIRVAERKGRKLGRLRPYQRVRARYNAAGVLARVEVVWLPSPPERPDEDLQVPFQRRGGRILRRQT
jgi:hypothetical protein